MAIATTELQIVRSGADVELLLGASIRSRIDEIERDRRLPPDLVEELTEAGLFRLTVPRRYGGLEYDLPTVVEIVEELARLDGSVGWCVMIASVGSVIGSGLPAEGRTELYGAGPDLRLAGTLPPNGRAVEVDGGFLFQGQWGFASGCQHADWLVAHAPLMGDDGPRLADSGMPEMRLALVPAYEATIVDTWTAAGLCGTGSHDFVLEDVFVPHRRAYSFLTGKRTVETALMRVPVLSGNAPALAAVGLGIARAALDAVREQVATKASLRSKFGAFATQSWLQTDLAKAEAQWGSARAFLYHAATQLWLEALADEVSLEARATNRMAACNAANAAVEVTRAALAMGGSTALYAHNPLQRYLRDALAVAQHGAVGQQHWETAGKVLLGQPADLMLF